MCVCVCVDIERERERKRERERAREGGMARPMAAKKYGFDTKLSHFYILSLTPMPIAELGLVKPISTLYIEPIYRWELKLELNDIGTHTYIY